MLLKIARFELLCRLKSKSFLVATCLVPLLCGALVIIPTVGIEAGKSVSSQTAREASLESKKWGIVDSVGIVGSHYSSYRSLGNRGLFLYPPALKENQEQQQDAGKPLLRYSPDSYTVEDSQKITLVKYKTLQDAKDDLKHELIGQVLHVHGSFLSSWKIDIYAHNINNDYFHIPERLRHFLQLIFLSTYDITDETTNKLLSPLDRDLFLYSNKSKGFNLVSEEEFFTKKHWKILLVIPAVIFFIVTFLLNVSYIQQRALEEKASNLIEVLFSCSSTYHILGGKTLAWGIVGGIQLLFWTLLTVLGLRSIGIEKSLATINISLGQLTGSLLMVAIVLTFGLLFMSSLIHWAAYYFRESGYSQFLSGAVQLTPLYAAPFFFKGHDSPLHWILMWNPLTGPGAFTVLACNSSLTLKMFFTYVLMIILSTMIFLRCSAHSIEKKLKR